MGRGHVMSCEVLEQAHRVLFCVSVFGRFVSGLCVAYLVICIVLHVICAAQSAPRSARMLMLLVWPINSRVCRKIAPLQGHDAW